MCFLGRRVLIAGACRGMGRTIALAFAREDADVAISYRGNREEAKAVVHEGLCCISRRSRIAVGFVGRGDAAKRDILRRVGPVGCRAYAYKCRRKTDLSNYATQPHEAETLGRKAVGPHAGLSAEGTVRELFQAAKAQLDHLVNIAGNWVINEFLELDTGRSNLPYQEENPEGWAACVARISLERAGTREDVAEAGLFLTSDNASWITEITLSQ